MIFFLTTSTTTFHLHPVERKNLKHTKKLRPLYFNQFVELVNSVQLIKFVSHLVLYRGPRSSYSSVQSAVWGAGQGIFHGCSLYAKICIKLCVPSQLPLFPSQTIWKNRMPMNEKRPVGIIIGWIKPKKLNLGKISKINCLPFFNYFRIINLEKFLEHQSFFFHLQNTWKWSICCAFDVPPNSRVEETKHQIIKTFSIFFNYW